MHTSKSAAQTSIFPRRIKFKNPQIVFDLCTWYYAAVSALASAGIVSGYNGFFRPDDTLTSGELITMLTRFVEAKTAPMPWVSYQGHWSYPSIVTAVSDGWIDDVSEIDPDRPVTRGEAVTWVNSIFELY